MNATSVDPPGGRGSAGLRVVHVTTAPETLGFLRGQAAWFRARGVSVSAISSPGPALERIAREEGMPCAGIPMERGIAPLRDLVALARLWRHLRRARPDVVDAHTPKAGLLGMIAAALAGVPVRVYHVHGLRFATTRGALRRLLVATERLAARLAGRVLCVSASVAAQAIAAGVAPGGKTAVLLAGSVDGVDARRFAPAAGPEAVRAARAALGLPPGARVVGYVGRLARDKGIAELAAAWRALRGVFPDAVLVLAGPPEPGDPAPAEALAALRADGRVHHLPYDPDVVRYYRAMDVVALPSHREGLGMTPLEAAAMGIPAVATRIPGCVDAVADGVTGTLVPPGDARALAAALAAYLADPALRASHGAAGRARVLRDFDPGAVRAALHAEYLRLLAGRRAPLAAAADHASASNAPG